jgi:hypothetical protein
MTIPAESRPEDRARANIDRLLTAAGWVIQDRNNINIEAGRGVAPAEVEGGSAQAALAAGVSGTATRPPVTPWLGVWGLRSLLGWAFRPRNFMKKVGQVFVCGAGFSTLSPN